MCERSADPQPQKIKTHPACEEQSNQVIPERGMHKKFFLPGKQTQFREEECQDKKNQHSVIEAG